MVLRPAFFEGFAQLSEHLSHLERFTLHSPCNFLVFGLSRVRPAKVDFGFVKKCPKWRSMGVQVDHSIKH